MTESIRNTLMSILERLSRHCEPQAGEGLESTLEHSWPWSPWVALIVFALVGGYVTTISLYEEGFASRRTKMLLALVRLTLVGLLICMMYGFTLRSFRTSLPEILILIDDSASMSVEDVFHDTGMQQAITERLSAAGLDGRQRINQAKALLLDADMPILYKLLEKYQVKVHLLSSMLPFDTGDRTDLANAIRRQAAVHPSSRLGDRLRSMLESQSGRPTAAVIVFTDGVTTSGETLTDMARYARRKRIPVFVVALGSDRPARDIELDGLLADDTVYVNDIVNFRFYVTATGYEGQEVEVSLREAGKQKVLTRRTLKLGADGQRARNYLQYRPREEGEFEYVVEIDVLDEEANPKNNRRQHAVNVRDEKINVLMVQAYPNYEFRFLKNLLGRERTDENGKQASPIQLTTILQEADLEYVDFDTTASRGFPVRREELFDYDVLIFGDVNPSLLSHSVTENIAEFVTERGGGVIFIAGPRYTPMAYRGTPLGDLMPFDLSSTMIRQSDITMDDAFVARPTRLGIASSHMQLGESPADSLNRWRNLPEMYWLWEALDMKPGVRVLAEHPRRFDGNGLNLPVICLQYVGAGKVVFHATDETWRWRLPRRESVFGRYWIQTIRFLSRSRLDDSREVQLITDRQRYDRGEPVRFRLRFFDERQAPVVDDGVTIVLQREGHASRRVTMRRDAVDHGIFATTVTNLDDGAYHAWLAAPSPKAGIPSCNFRVTVPDREMTQLAANLVDLKRAADDSKGRYYTFWTAANLIDDLPEGHHVRLESLPPEPIWNSWLVVVLFVGLLISEWLLRKRAGLL